VYFCVIMKKLIFVVAIAITFAMSSAFVPISSNSNVVVATKHVQGEICFKIKNDTGNSITLHTGTGTAPMNNGSQKEFCIKEGMKLCIADKGRPGKVLLTVSSDISGKTFKLSELM